MAVQLGCSVEEVKALCATTNAKFLKGPEGVVPRCYATFAHLDVLDRPRSHVSIGPMPTYRMVDVLHIAIPA